jgi:hypothetical protein
MSGIIGETGIENAFDARMTSQIFRDLERVRTLRAYP